METYLNVTPGSATVMGLIFDQENKVQLLVDDKFLKEIHHDYITVKLSDGNEQE